MPKYIHELSNWPTFFWDAHQVLPKLSSVRHKQGRLLGMMSAMGFELKNEAILKTLTTDVLKSSEIEGELLNTEQVRSSIARKLGLNIPGIIKSDRNVDGIVEVMVDATQHYNKPLSAKRIFGWHAALFPTGYSGMYKITVGNWRKPEGGPMQVVSGALGFEKVHYEAPEASRLAAEMKQFIAWFNKPNEDPLLKSAIAHLWFVTVHPFDDGNGRIARAIADKQLAKADGDCNRFYSVSAQIRLKRNAYYNLLEKTQKGDLNITEWLLWFLECVDTAIEEANHIVQVVSSKTTFWENHALTALNERQRLIINKLFDGFVGKLNSSKWAKINKCSPDTALRDINDLIQKKILVKEAALGRSTTYQLK